MSGYTPVFGSLFQGTLCGQWPALPVFCTLLPLADKDGRIDYSFQYLAVTTGWPVDLLKQGIAQLEQPDPYSRSPSDDGRRLVRLREHTDWGWQVVNHAAYREKARQQAQNAAQVADGRNAEKVRRYKERKANQDTAGHRETPETPETPRHTLSNANTNPLQDGSANGRKRPSRRCPADFVPDEEYAKREIPDLDYPRESQRFKDYEFKTPRSDWGAAWRNWIRTCRDTGKYAKAGEGIKWV